jgi:hypothetical protein
MSAGGAGAASDPRVAIVQEMAQSGRDFTDAEKLEQLAVEAEAAADGADAKVEKQQWHLTEAEAIADELRAVADKAREAADNAK